MPVRLGSLLRAIPKCYGINYNYGVCAPINRYSLCISDVSLHLSRILLQFSTLANEYPATPVYTLELRFFLAIPRTHARSTMAATTGQFHS